MGLAVLAAIANPDPAAIPEFATLGDTIGTWCVANVECTPGTMVAAGSAVNGLGAIAVQGEADDLGKKLAIAMKDPSADGVRTWTKFAKALLTHMKTFGSVNASTFTASPSGGPLGGTGKIVFTNPLFTPLLSSALGVDDPVAAAMLEVFGAQILAHIALAAVVMPATILSPFIPLTAPSGGGPVTGAGAIT